MRLVAVIAAVAVVGWLARLAPLILHGSLGSPVDYDEGVYFTVAALLARGHGLYRQFVTVHPPGLFYVLAPLTFLGRPSRALLVSEVAMTIVGGVNVYLVGRIASRFVSPAAAVAGALIYAFFPEAVRSEHGVFLEPVLNLLCLGGIMLWLGHNRDRSPARADRSAWATGLLLGAATAVKLWGGLAVVACLVAARPGRWRRDAWRLVGGAVASFALLVLPAALSHPGNFWQQAGLFQLHRAPEPLGIAKHIRFILFNPTTPGAGLWDHRSLIGAAVALVALVAFFVGPRTLMLRLALAWYLVLVAAFLVSASYYEQYNAHLAPALALLGASAVNALVTGLRSKEGLLRRVACGTGAVVVGATFLVAVRGVVMDGGRHTGDLTAIGQAVRGHDGGCVFSFEPQWLLAADRLPDPDRLGSMAVDTYATQLDAVVRSGRSPHDASTAFADPASAVLVDRAVRSCDAVVLGDRGRRQLGDLLPSFLQRFHRVAATSDRGPDLWLRNAE